ncbi:MAG: hypothetical protein H7312_20015 [Tardiphaga sp.]|nr:hypothetical protein [Tardiphaga sp.]
MPYALFSNAVQVSNAFATKSEVWQHAAARGLVIEVGSGEEDPPRRILDMGYSIHACADLAPITDSAEHGESDIARLIAAGAFNLPSAAAAS